MKTKRTIELTIERSELLVLRKARRSFFGWCEVCGTRVQMMTPEEAAVRAGVGARAIYQKVESGELHFLETPEGPLLVCVNSVM